jgi:hypothetical protein
VRTRRPRLRDFKLTVRRTGATERSRFETLDVALRALETRLDELATTARPLTQRSLTREYAPVRQVAARGEIAGPRGLRGGVDLRGDGSAEAFTGRWRRTLVERQSGETPYDALARALGT